MNGRLKIVLSAVDDPDRAVEIARRLVEEGLVACAQVGSSPLSSVWWWQGRVESGEEWGLSLKVVPERLAAARARLLDLHPYDTPEFVVIDATATDEYARWARESTA